LGEDINLLVVSQAHEQKIMKRNGDKKIEHALQSELSLKRQI